MNIKILIAAMGIALTTIGINAKAQTAYTEGLVTLSTQMRGQNIQIKNYFNADSSAMAFTMGPASIKILSNAKQSFFAILVDVPAASIKKAGIATPAEIEQALNAMPKFTFAPTTETKHISGFNCKKVIATDTKTNKTYDVWITNDVTLPENAITKYYENIGGFPIKYTSFSQGQESDITVVSIANQKVPAGTFSISPDYDKITLEELNNMKGGN